MSWSRSAAIMRNEFRVLRTQAGSLVSLIAMPLVMIAFFKPLARLALAEDNPGANGSEFTVPAMATMFAFFLVAMVGFSFLSERQWSTWERLLASPATNAEIVLGKVIPAFCLCVFQQAMLFGFGFAVFGLRTEGSVVALALVVLALCICLTGLGLLLAALFKTNQQLNAFSNIATMLLAGVSGAFVPLEVLPRWARAVAPISPQYWALRGYRSVILDAGGIDVVALPVVVLVAIAVGAAGLALLRLRFDEDVVRVAASPTPALSVD